MSGFELGSLGGDAGSDGPLRGWSGVFPSFASFGRGLQPLLFPLCLFVVWVILGSKIKLGSIVITSVAYSFHMLLPPVPFEPYCFFCFYGGRNNIKYCVRVSVKLYTLPKFDNLAK